MLSITENYKGGTITTHDGKTFTWTADPAGNNKRRVIEKAEQHAKNNDSIFMVDGKPTSAIYRDEMRQKQDEAKQQVKKEIEAKRPQKNHFHRIADEFERAGTNDITPGAKEKLRQKIERYRQAGYELDQEEKERKTVKTEEYKIAKEGLEATIKRGTDTEKETLILAQEYLDRGMIEECNSITSQIITDQINRAETNRLEKSVAVTKAEADLAHATIEKLEINKNN